MFIIDVKLSTQREREREGERGIRNTCTYLYCRLGLGCCRFLMVLYAQLHACLVFIFSFLMIIR